MKISRHVKISFRRKPNSRDGVIKIFCTVRLPGFTNPKQLHLGYLAVHNGVPPAVPTKIESNLRKHWLALFPNEEVSVDWEDFHKKWSGNHDQRERSKVDRSHAIVQLNLWRSIDKETEIKWFGGTLDEAEVGKTFAENERNPKPINAEEENEHDPESLDAEDTGKFFNDGLRKLNGVLARKLPKEPPDMIEDWWLYEEVPRLLYRFHHYTKTNPQPKHAFSRVGFLHYLAANIWRGYAAVQFLRHKHRDFKTTVAHDVNQIPTDWSR